MGVPWKEEELKSFVEEREDVKAVDAVAAMLTKSLTGLNRNDYVLQGCSL